MCHRLFTDVSQVVYRCVTGCLQMCHRLFTDVSQVVSKPQSLFEVQFPLIGNSVKKHLR